MRKFKLSKNEYEKLENNGHLIKDGYIFVLDKIEGILIGRLLNNWTMNIDCANEQDRNF